MLLRETRSLVKCYYLKPRQILGSHLLIRCYSLQCGGEMFCVLVTFRFQLPPLAKSNVKRRAECISLSLPVQSLSFDKPYIVLLCGDIGN